MKRAQEQVEEFHRAMDSPNGDRAAPGFSRVELRMKLIRDEVKELFDAIALNDFVEAVDALADISYVVIGTAAEWGVDLAPIWDEVHRSNMAKKGGEKRADGKILKPPGWTPPDIAGVLARQMRSAEIVEEIVDEDDGA